MFTSTKLFFASIFVVLFAGMSFLTLSEGDPLEPQVGQFGSTLYPANVAGALAGCGGFFKFTPEEGYYGAVPVGYDGMVPNPPMMVPTYGAFTSEVFPEDRVGVPADRQEAGLTQGVALRAMWEGYTILWIDDAASDEAYDFLVDYVVDWNASHSGTDRLILSRWDFDEERAIPLDRQSAFSAWGMTTSCAGFSPAVLEDFLTL